MKADIRALGTFNRLSREGAERAASSLRELTGISTAVDVAGVYLNTVPDLADELGDRRFEGVRVGFDGGLRGHAVLSFDPESADVLGDSLVPDSWVEAGEDMERSGVMESGNIVLTAFLNGWADHYGEKIAVSTPTYVEGVGTNVIPDGVSKAETVFSLSSELQAPDGMVEFQIHVFPEPSSLLALDAGNDYAGSPVPMSRLSAFDRMTHHGVNNAAEKITSMAGIETDVEITQLKFIPIEDVPGQTDDDEVVAVVVEFEGLPSGYIVILFDEPSAHALADSMVPTDTGDDGDLTGMQLSAIQEIGNLMTSGFVDGWANVLGTSTKLSSPEVLQDSGPAILGSVAARLGQQQEHAFLHDSVIVTPEREIECKLYALPNERELQEALNALSVEDGDADGAIPDSALEMTKSYEELQ